MLSSPHVVLGLIWRADADVLFAKLGGTASLYLSILEATYRSLDCHIAPTLDVQFPGEFWSSKRKRKA